MVIEDITEREQLERRLRQSQRLESLGCRLPRVWDHRERGFATVMGPPGCQ
jgi:hypothetical protein